MTGVYLQLVRNKHGRDNFIWKGTVSGMPEKIIQLINSFTKKTLKQRNQFIIIIFENLCKYR